jgi:hypothetical protein
VRWNCVVELCVVELCVVELCVVELCVVELCVVELCVVELCVVELCFIYIYICMYVHIYISPHNFYVQSNTMMGFNTQKHILNGIK